MPAIAREKASHLQKLAREEIVESTMNIQLRFWDTLDVRSRIQPPQQRREARKKIFAP